MKITLPDNSSRELPQGSSGYDLAKDIGPGLAKSAVAVSVNGVQRDLHDVIEGDASVSIITIDSDEGIEIMRHTLTCLLYTSPSPRDKRQSRMPSSA